MAAHVPVHRLEQVVRPVAGWQLLVLLAAVAVLLQHPIRHLGGELVAPDGFYRGKADVDLPAFLLGCPDDGAGRQLGLKTRRSRLRTTRVSVGARADFRHIEAGKMTDELTKASAVCHHL